MIEVSKKVFIRRKPGLNAFANANEKTLQKLDSTFKIGSSLTRSGNVNKGVVHEDEARYMPDIVSLRPDDINFRTAVEDYWNNIAVYIPKGDGKEIEVGFQYENEEARNKGEADGTWETRQKYGKPIVLEDYLLYRYCLVYSRVANTIADIDASNRIRFYLHTREEETRTKYNQLEQTKNATVKLLEFLADRNMVKTLLYIYERTDLEDTRDQDLFLWDEIKNDPQRFITLVADEDLQTRAFIYKCISSGLLSRQPNTEVIFTDDTNILAYTINDAIAALKTERHAPLMTRLRAQLGGKYATEFIPNPESFLTGNKKEEVKTVPPAPPAPPVKNPTKQN